MVHTSPHCFTVEEESSSGGGHAEGNQSTGFGVIDAQSLCRSCLVHVHIGQAWQGLGEIRHKGRNLYRSSVWVPVGQQYVFLRLIRFPTDSNCCRLQKDRQIHVRKIASKPKQGLPSKQDVESCSWGAIREFWVFVSWSDTMSQVIVTSTGYGSVFAKAKKEQADTSYRPAIDQLRNWGRNFMIGSPGRGHKLEGPSRAADKTDSVW